MDHGFWIKLSAVGTRWGPSGQVTPSGHDSRENIVTVMLTLWAESDFPAVSGCGGSTGGHGRLAFNKTGCNILLKEGG